MIGFLLFIGSVAAVYMTAVAMIVDLAVKNFFGTPDTPTRRLKALRYSIFALAIIGLLCMSYGLYVEPYWLSISRVTLHSPKLSAGTRPIRIVQVSDLHCDYVARLEPRLPEVVQRETPDIILFTGDAINSPRALPLFRDCLTRLSMIAPTYVVKGNWDSLYWNNLNLFGETGAKELKGESAQITVNGTKIWIAGAPIEVGMKEKALVAVPHDALTLFLYHYPSGILEAAAKGVDLVLTGHTHGGQVALPAYGAIITLSQLGKRYEAGLYKVQDSWLYVNRGIGMEGGVAPRVRFCARPEVTVFEIRPSSQPAR